MTDTAARKVGRRWPGWLMGLAREPLVRFLLIGAALFAGMQMIRAAQALERAEEDQREPQGDPFLFPLAYDDVNLPDLLRDYGNAFVKTLETAPVGGWAGPVLSPYGWHIVKVTSRKAGAATSFDQVRDQVRDAYMLEGREAARAAFMRDLRKRYRVVVAGVDQ